MRRHVGRLLRRYADRLAPDQDASPDCEPLVVALAMVRAAAGAEDPAGAVRPVARELIQIDEKYLPAIAVHLAVLLAHPPRAPRSTPAETGAWADDMRVFLEFDALVRPLREVGGQEP